MRKIEVSTILVCALIISTSLLSACASRLSGESTPGGAPPVDQERIRRTILSHQSEIGACYESAIDARPGAMGKVVVAFDIVGEGAATNVTYPQIDPSLTDIRSCITDVFSKMKFDPTTGNVVAISYPFFFDERLPNRTNKSLKRFEKGRSLKPAPPQSPPKSP